MSPSACSRIRGQDRRPLIFLAARLHLIALPRPLRPLVDRERVRAPAARLDLAAMVGLATIGSTARVLVMALARAAGVESLIAMIVLGEPAAYAAMGALSAWRWRSCRPGFSHLLWGLEHGLVGAAAWSLTSLAPHTGCSWHELVGTRVPPEAKMLALVASSAVVAT